MSITELSNDISITDTSTINNKDDNMCGICLEEFNCKTDSDIIVTLKCKHRYCYECICDSYLKSKEKRQCPYCRKMGGFLPLPESATPLKFIHEEYVIPKLSKLPLIYSLSHYYKSDLIVIAKQLGIPLFNDKYKKKLKEELYHDINIAYNKDNIINYKL